MRLVFSLCITVAEWDQWERLGISFNILKEEENGYWINFCKKGNMSWKRAEFFINPATKLNKCEVCAKASTPKNVQNRNDVLGWNGVYRSTMLCMGCYNKVRAIVKREDEAKEIRKLTNKLNGEIKKWQKSQLPAN